MPPKSEGGGRTGYKQNWGAKKLTLSFGIGQEEAHPGEPPLFKMSLKHMRG